MRGSVFVEIFIKFVLVSFIILFLILIWIWYVYILFIKYDKPYLVFKLHTLCIKKGWYGIEFKKYSTYIVDIFGSITKIEELDNEMLKIKAEYSLDPFELKYNLVEKCIDDFECKESFASSMKSDEFSRNIELFLDKAFKKVKIKSSENEKQQEKIKSELEKITSKKKVINNFNSNDNLKVISEELIEKSLEETSTLEKFNQKIIEVNKIIGTLDIEESYTIEKIVNVRLPYLLKEYSQFNQKEKAKELKNITSIVEGIIEKLDICLDNAKTEHRNSYEKEIILIENTLK